MCGVVESAGVCTAEADPCFQLDGGRGYRVAAFGAIGSHYEVGLMGSFAS